MTFNEAYEALSEEQKRYFTNIREYALSKQDAEERLTKNGVTVYVNNMDRTGKESDLIAKSS